MTARQEEQPVEHTEQRFRSSRFVRQFLSLRAPDLRPDVALVKPLKEYLDRRAQIDSVKTECGALSKACGVVDRSPQGPELDVFPVAFSQATCEELEQRSEGLLAVDQGFAVVGEGQGDQPPPREPAIDTAENEAVLQLHPRGRCGVRDWLICVSSIQSVQPTARMEDAGGGVLLDEFWPARVLQGIERVDEDRYDPSVVNATVSPSRTANAKRACSFPSPSIRGPLPSSTTDI